MPASIQAVSFSPDRPAVHSDAQLKSLETMLCTVIEPPPSSSDEVDPLLQFLHDYLVAQFGEPKPIDQEAG